MRAYLALLLPLALPFASGCGDDGGGGDPDAAAIDAAIIDALEIDAPFVAPTMLSETGLYSDIGTKTIASDVIEYAPRWHLWSDAAVKRRWISLPPGARIDTTDMDFWSFPTGTRFWKEFSRGGKRIETRLLQKIGPEDDVASWFMVSFQWDAGETDAVAVPGGVVDDTGVDDIPDRSKCRQCHGPNRNKAVILGFQALQLDYAPGGTDPMNLARLVADDLLTTAPSGGGVPYFPLPSSGAGVDVTTPALGYLHANCGGCHNEFSDVKNTVDLELRLNTAAAERTTWDATRPWMFTVGAGGTGVPAQLTGAGTHIVRPMDTAQSAIHNRMNQLGGMQMPPIAREQIDTTALAEIDAWINALPVN